MSRLRIAVTPGTQQQSVKDLTTSQQNTDSKGSSASVGIGFWLGGSSNGFTLNLGVTGSRGQADGDELTHTNTRIEAGNALLLQSGRDTNIKGAVATGKQVVAQSQHRKPARHQHLKGLESDVGGHVQACSQGGTCDGYNLFPQDSNFNNSAYKFFMRI
ncbi:hemagglutinin repeat-containing protein [Pseudomonas sp. 21C1]|uniref:hemagglutinin repeat-containing protein n=1 Tax=Pseudomonas sp. 21C1 TaxID=1843690 RepID=UPI000ACE532A|nr:hemagglutinin repeat-containing protein [Pseudomonas sp. 21C1]